MTCPRCGVPCDCQPGRCRTPLVRADRLSRLPRPEPLRVPLAPEIEQSRPVVLDVALGALYGLAWSVVAIVLALLWLAS